jgi:hypothetical protein
MKFSEAIVLGTTTGNVKFNSCAWRSCLIGVGLSALSVPGSHPAMFSASISRGPLTTEALSRWPWLSAKFKAPTPLLEGVGSGPFSWAFSESYDYLGIHIVSGFATRIQVGRLTLEDALAWIRSVEPEDDSIENKPANNSGDQMDSEKANYETANQG